MTKHRRLRARALWLGLAAWAASAGVLGASARADFINYDPDGTSAPNGSSLPTQTISGFDLSVGNVLAQGSNAAVAAAAGGAAPNTPATTFQIYFQANLAGLIDTGGTSVAPTGNNRTFETTVIASVTETVTSFTANTGGTSPQQTLRFAVANTQSPQSFVRFYYDQNPNPGTQPPTAASWPTQSNNLAGTGFNDGTLILTGFPIATPDGTGGFGVNLASPTGVTPVTQRYDQFPDSTAASDNYGGKQSLVGNGSSVIQFLVTGTPDPNFFKTILPRLSFNTSQVTPFQSVDPSKLFTALTGAVNGIGGTFTPITPNTGPDSPAGTNGFTGTDFQFQADANVVPVPEPASMTLLGLGLAGAFGYGWRKRK